MLFLTLPTWAYSVNDKNVNGCENTNPYSQHLCEKLKQSSDAIRQSREEAYKKELMKRENDVEKRIEEERKMKKDTSSPLSPQTYEPPDWQKALNKENQPLNAPADNSSNQLPEQNEASSAVTNLPNPGPTQFSTPQSVTLPGGIKMIPVPHSKQNKEEKNTPYY